MQMCYSAKYCLCSFAGRLKMIYSVILILNDHHIWSFFLKTGTSPPSLSNVDNLEFDDLTFYKISKYYIKFIKQDFYLRSFFISINSDTSIFIPRKPSVSYCQGTIYIWTESLCASSEKNETILVIIILRKEFLWLYK